MLKKLLCLVGLHDLEKNPSYREQVKGTGTHFLFFSSGIQKGIKKCIRSGCGFEQKVYRKGMVGVGCPEPTWEKLTAETEQYIDSLPGVFQS